MKQYRFRVAYRKFGDIYATVRTTEVTAKSAEEARAAVLAANSTYGERWTILDTARLDIARPKSFSTWQRKEPNRKRSQIYICPHCKESCYAASSGCDYKFCPRCGEEVSVTWNGD